MADQVTIVAHDVGPVGGMERQLTELITALVADGSEVTVIARRCALPQGVGARHIRVLTPPRPFAVAYPLFLLAGTVITAFARRGLLQTTGAIVLNRSDVCTVHLCHHGLRRTGLLRSARDRSMYRFNARVASTMSVFAERVCFPRARALVAVSTGVAAEVRDAFPAIASRVTVIPNGVDAERFRPGDRARTELRAVFVGSEWDGKGLAIVIEALRGAPGWHLDVLGTGDRPRFEHLAAEAGVASRVTFWGEQPAPERFYGAASAFVLPSVYETFSLVTYEAAAAGVPLLATRVSGVEDLLQDGVNGWFIDRDSATIAARLQTLADDPARAAAMSAAARQAALRFDWERMVVGFRSLYDDLRPTR